MDSKSSPLTFSQEIKKLLAELAHRPLTLAYLINETSERGFSLVIGLLVLPFLIPVPPGLTTILGSACLLLSLQMTLGRKSPWLPEHVAHFQFPSVLARQILNSLEKSSRYVERLVRPRFTHLANSSQVWKINGACISWLTILLMLPIPMTNPIPAIGILMIAIATLEADGLLMCLGYGMTLLTTGLFGAIGYLLWQFPEFIQNWFK